MRKSLRFLVLVAVLFCFVGSASSVFATAATRRAGMTLFAAGKAPTPGKADILAGRTTGFITFVEETIPLAYGANYYWRPYFYTGGALMNFRALHVRIDACARTTNICTLLIRRWPCPGPTAADSCYTFISTDSDSLDSGRTFVGPVDSLEIRCLSAGSFRITEAY